jgi:plasmid stabilization system protein ParE
MKTTKLSNLSNALQKQIILAHNAAVAGDTDNAISAIAEALKLKPDVDTRKLLESINEEFSTGSVPLAEYYINSLFRSTCKSAPVQTVARIAELERKNAELVDALENLTTTGEQCFSDLLSMGLIRITSGSAYRRAKQSAADAIQAVKGEFEK